MYQTDILIAGSDGMFEEEYLLTCIVYGLAWDSLLPNAVGSAATEDNIQSVAARRLFPRIVALG